MTGRWLLCAALAGMIAGCGDSDDKPASVPLDAAPPPLAAPPARVGPAEPVARDEVATERVAVPELAGLPMAQGRWAYARDDRGAVARFAGQLSIRCLPGTLDMEIVRGGAAGRSITVLADRGANLFDAQPMKVVSGDATVARFPANYPWFDDVLAKATGAIGIRVDAGTPLVVPADPAIARVIDGCRPGG